MNITNISKTSKELKKLLKLKNSPVAVGLVSNNHKIPENIDKINEKMCHCQMVNKIRKENIQFYALEEDHQCKNGAAVMGMRKLKPEFANGTDLFKENHYKNIYSAKKTMEKVPTLESGTIRSIIYSPLEKVNFIPDVVLIIDTPKKVMQISQAFLYCFGGHLNVNYTGILSLCADGVVKPYKNGQISVTLGCEGSRDFADIEENEMIIGIPTQYLDYIVEGANKMFS